MYCYCMARIQAWWSKCDIRYEKWYHKEKKYKKVSPQRGYAYLVKKKVS